MLDEMSPGRRRRGRCCPWLDCTREQSMQSRAPEEEEKEGDDDKEEEEAGQAGLPS